MRRLGLILLLLLLPTAAGAQPDLEVVAPAEAVLLTRMPLGIELDMTDTAVTSTLQVLLNGGDIAAEFTLDPPANGRIRASVSAFWDATLVLEGANSIQASVDVPGGTAQATRDFETFGDPYADSVVSHSIGTDGGFKSSQLPGIVLGAPEGSGLFQGGLDVVSLGLGGEIVLEFEDNQIVDGPGADFIVFENPFLEDDNGQTAPPFMEPGRVSVSQDGTVWHVFSSCALDPGQAGQFHPGCAGVYPVLSRTDPGFPHASIPSSVPIEDLVGKDIDTLQVPEGAGGDAFDLADVGLSSARFVRIESAGFATPPAAAPTVGSDLDAVAAVHSLPLAPVPAAPPGLLPWLAAGLLLGGRWVLSRPRAGSAPGR